MPRGPTTPGATAAAGRVPGPPPSRSTPAPRSSATPPARGGSRSGCTPATARPPAARRAPRAVRPGSPPRPAPRAGRAPPAPAADQRRTPSAGAHSPCEASRKAASSGSPRPTGLARSAQRAAARGHPHARPRAAAVPGCRPAAPLRPPPAAAAALRAGATTVTPAAASRSAMRRQRVRRGSAAEAVAGAERHAGPQPAGHRGEPGEPGRVGGVGVQVDRQPELRGEPEHRLRVARSGRGRGPGSRPPRTRPSSARPAASRARPRPPRRSAPAASPPPSDVDEPAQRAPGLQHRLQRAQPLHVADPDVAAHARWRRGRAAAARPRWRGAGRPRRRRPAGRAVGGQRRVAGGRAARRGPAAAGSRAGRCGRRARGPAGGGGEAARGADRLDPRAAQPDVDGAAVGEPGAAQQQGGGLGGGPRGLSDDRALRCGPPAGRGCGALRGVAGRELRAAGGRQDGSEAASGPRGTRDRACGPVTQWSSLGPGRRASGGGGSAESRTGRGSRTGVGRGGAADRGARWTARCAPPDTDFTYRRRTV